MLKKISLTFLIVISCLFILLRIFSSSIISYINDIDTKYGDTIPNIKYDETLWPNHNTFNKIYQEGRISVSNLYSDNNNGFEKIVLEQNIIHHWEPYLKKPNETIIYVQYKNNNIELKFIENTGVYASANSAREAIRRGIEKTSLNATNEIDAIFMFTVK